METDNKAIHVYLVDDSDNLNYLWLPAKKEGRYSFNILSKGKTYQIDIDAVHDEWMVSCSGDGDFVLGGSPCGNEIQLNYNVLYQIKYETAEFLLYAQQESEGDNLYSPYFVDKLSNAVISIGRLEANEIVYSYPSVSRYHAQLSHNANGWRIKDSGSANGVFLNGHRIYDEALSVGDVVYIMGLYIIIGVHCFAINNPNGAVKVNNTSNFVYTRTINVLKDEFADENKKGVEFFDRNPRKAYKYTPDKIEIDTPPTSLKGNKVPFLLRMGNSIISGGRSLMQGNVLNTITSLVLPFTTQGMSEKDRKDYEVKRVEFYHDYLENVKFEIENEKKQEFEQLNGVYPPLSNVIRYSQNRGHLWERRNYDDDFLSVRIGAGNLPMLAEKSYSKQKVQMEPDPLIDQMMELAQREEYVKDAPIMLSLKEDFVVGVKGNRASQISLAKKMILQLVFTHSYDEVKIVVLCDAKEAGEFDFIKYLPHNWDDELSVRFFAESKSDTQQISKHLITQYDTVQELTGKTRTKVPSYVVFALDKELYESIELFKTIQDLDEYGNFSLITLFDNVPKECTKLILAENPCRLIDLYNPEVKEITFAQDSYSESELKESLKTLGRLKLRLASKAFALPPSVTFMEMYHAGKVEHLNPLRRWRENNPEKSLAAPIGIGTDGQIFTLDLHEKRQGPHGLIAGGTGSGKSEFIITYILSMALNYSPDEVAFVLIDYKGGGLTDAFVNPKIGLHLPHVVGTITNLDGAAVQRSIVSLNSELKRRQALFTEAKAITNEGTMDIYSYQKYYRNHVLKEPLPHLFIIADEFAEMKKQQPEFMDELISIARIGRSLGVHLILATQRPTGVVNDQIMSNVKFRVCLKVADKSDSMEMIRRPDAAEIKNIGRFYLQVGFNEYFAQGQSAWSGADYIESDEVQTKVDKSVQILDNTGQTVLSVKPEEDVKKSDSKQIVAIVRYLSRLAEQEGIKPRSLWRSPLAKQIELKNMPEFAGKGNSNLPVVVGMVDDPAKQRQFPYILELNSFRNLLICGNAASGKSTLIRSVLYHAVARYTPEEFNYYVLDLSGGALREMSYAKHCGAYLTDKNEDEFYRLLKMMDELVEERKKKFEAAGVTNYASYRNIEQIPRILFIVDGYTNINVFKKGPEIHASLYGRAREWPSYGVSLVLSVNHMNEVHSKTKQEIDGRIALQAKDRYEFTEILDVKCTSIIPATPGRGMCVCDGEPYEFQTASVYAGMDEIERVKQVREDLNAINEDTPESKYPARLLMPSEDEEYADFCKKFEKERIPLGYSLSEMKQVAMPFNQLFSMSLYFGNSFGKQFIWENILTAAEKNGMELIVVKQSSGSFFSDMERVRQYFTGEIKFYQSTVEDLVELDKQICYELIQKRKVYRDEYCQRYNIPTTDVVERLKASKYIREHTVPVLIIFERFAELFNLLKDEEIVSGDYQRIFDRTRGYNYYFIGGFTPDDEGLYDQALLKTFNKDEFCLFFGGRYDKQQLVTSLPMDLRKKEAEEKDYRLFYMKYNNVYYSMRMPCGVLKEKNTDPDDDPII